MKSAFCVADWQFHNPPLTVKVSQGVSGNKQGRGLRQAAGRENGRAVQSRYTGKNQGKQNRQGQGKLGIQKTKRSTNTTTRYKAGTRALTQEQDV